MKILLLFWVLSNFAEGIRIKSSHFFVETNNKIASTLYTEAAESFEKNFVVSPFSTVLNLVLAYLGSGGETTEEFRNALNVSGTNGLVILEIIYLLPKLREEYDFRIANKLYIRDDLQVESAFLTSITNILSAELENIDFRQNVEAAESINNWFENTTKIRNLINEDASEWSPLPFRNFPFIGNFSKAPSEEVEVELNYQGWNQAIPTGESSILDAKFVRLPLENQASLTIIVPNKKDGLGELQKNISSVLSFEFDNITASHFRVIYPKFKISNTIDLKNSFRKLNVTLAFNASGADFSDIVGDEGDLFISDVVQKSFIEVNKNGVNEGVAPSASYLSLPVTPGPIPPFRLEVFRADHPFIFYVKIRGIIVYVGRVVDPTL